MYILLGCYNFFKREQSYVIHMSWMLFVVYEISFNTDMEEDGGMSHEHQLAFS